MRTGPFQTRRNAVTRWIAACAASTAFLFAGATCAMAVDLATEEVVEDEVVEIDLNVGVGRAEPGQPDDALDDDDLEPEPAVQQPRFQVSDAQFDQWMFNQVGNAQKATERFQSMLNVQVDAIAANCDLSPEQKQKLLLAGRGDVIRYFDKVEVCRQKFQKLKTDQNRINEVLRDIQPLQIASQAGIFGNDSFFHKVVKKTLSDEQRERMERLEKDRTKYQFKAKIELIVAALDDTLALRAEQRKELIEMLQSTPPPKRFGPYDSYLLLYRISQLPELKIQAILDPPQLRALDKQLEQARNLQPFLKQQGLLSDDD
jgi:hypothetical protein